jgi:hypothetical protein
MQLLFILKMQSKWNSKCNNKVYNFRKEIFCNAKYQIILVFMMVSFFSVIVYFIKMWSIVTLKSIWIACSLKVLPFESTSYFVSSLNYILLALIFCLFIATI